MRVALYTLGCKVNQYESAALAEAFSDRGHRVVSCADQADLYVVNTCAVTAKAAYQSRQMLRRFRRNAPAARVLATGCYVQIGAVEILDHVPGPICLVGNDKKGALVDLALDRDDCLELYIGDVRRPRTIEPFFIRHPLERTRAFVRIQDGCNAYCAYCVVPYTRGASRSLAPVMAHEQIAVLAENGMLEIVLTGIHVGAYGKDLEPATTLLALLEGLAGSFPSLRFRLSSIEPTELGPDMIRWACTAPNFCQHWHVPLQSGSDRTLARMNRHYTAGEFALLVRSLREAMPTAAIGADVLVGFPGEDELAFRETLDLLNVLPITYLHTFPFSPRPGTLAEALPEPVSRMEKARRVKALRELGAAKQHAFYRAQEGRVLSCLVEQRDRRTGLWRGLSTNYVRVTLRDADPSLDLRNSYVDVRVTQSSGGEVHGELVR